MYMLEVFLRDD